MTNESDGWRALPEWEYAWVQLRECAVSLKADVPCEVCTAALDALMRRAIAVGRKDAVTALGAFVGDEECDKAGCRAQSIIGRMCLRCRIRMFTEAEARADGLPQQQPREPEEA